jgi:hypothetical protein
VLETEFDGAKESSESQTRARRNYDAPGEYDLSLVGSDDSAVHESKSSCVGAIRWRNSGDPSLSALAEVWKFSRRHG